MLLSTLFFELIKPYIKENKNIPATLATEIQAIFSAYLEFHKRKGTLDDTESKAELKKSFINLCLFYSKLKLDLTSVFLIILSEYEELKDEDIFKKLNVTLNNQSIDNNEKNDLDSLKHYYAFILFGIEDINIFVKNIFVKNKLSNSLDFFNKLKTINLSPSRKAESKALDPLKIALAEKIKFDKNFKGKPSFKIERPTIQYNISENYHFPIDPAVRAAFDSSLKLTTETRLYLLDCLATNPKVINNDALLMATCNELDDLVDLFLSENVNPFAYNRTPLRASAFIHANNSQKEKFLNKLKKIPKETVEKDNLSQVKKSALYDLSCIAQEDSSTKIALGIFAIDTGKYDLLEQLISNFTKWPSELTDYEWLRFTRIYPTIIEYQAEHAEEFKNPKNSYLLSLNFLSFAALSEDLTAVEILLKSNKKINFDDILFPLYICIFFAKFAALPKLVNKMQLLSNTDWKEAINILLIRVIQQKISIELLQKIFEVITASSPSLSDFYKDLLSEEVSSKYCEVIINHAYFSPDSFGNFLIFCREAILIDYSLAELVKDKLQSIYLNLQLTDLTKQSIDITSAITFFIAQIEKLIPGNADIMCQVLLLFSKQKFVPNNMLSTGSTNKDENVQPNLILKQLRPVPEKIMVSYKNSMISCAEMLLSLKFNIAQPTAEKTMLIDSNSIGFRITLLQQACNLGIPSILNKVMAKGKNLATLEIFLILHFGHADCLKLVLDKLDEKSYLHDFFRNHLPLVAAASGGYLECVKILYEYLKKNIFNDNQLKRHVKLAYESCNITDKVQIEIRYFLWSKLRPKYQKKLDEKKLEEKKLEEKKSAHRIKIESTQKRLQSKAQINHPPCQEDSTEINNSIESVSISRYQRITFFDPNKDNSKCIAYIPKKQWNNLHKNQHEDFERTLKLYSQLGFSKRLIVFNDKFKYRGHRDERYWLREVPFTDIPCQDEIDASARYFTCYEKQKHENKAIMK